MDANTPPERIIVVGAGMAGLAAAQWLHDAGFQVVVLEARDRLGGRIHTSHAWGFPLDLGAAWVHGKNRNPLVPIIKRYGAKLEQTDWDDMSRWFDSAKPDLEDESIWRKVRQFERRLQRRTAQAAHGDTDVSIESLVEQIVRELNLSKTEQGVLNVELTGLELDEGTDLSDVSAGLWNIDHEYGGGDHLVVNGYSTLIDGLASGLDIKTGLIVRRITQSDAGVQVFTDDGAYDGDRVVVTLPLGVLQNGDVDFVPQLPDAKREAIGRLGMGRYEKVIMRFRTAHWPADAHAFFHTASERDGLPLVFNLGHYHDVPVLVAAEAGRRAAALIKRSDDDIVRDAVSRVRKMFGSNVLDPDESIVTRWGLDPFSQGSYSFNKVGALPGDRDALASPIENRIFFAGEATERELYATVHGAYRSGVRAANAINEIVAEERAGARR